MTSIALLMAAILTFSAGAAHSWLGERRLIGPLLAPGRRQGILERSDFARQVLRFAWHLTTVAWWGIGAMLISAAVTPLDPSSHSILAIIAVTFFITGIVILVAGRGRHLAWPIFLAIAGLASVPLL
jgi:hypothetical protein